MCTTALNKWKWGLVVFQVLAESVPITTFLILISTQRRVRGCKHGCTVCNKVCTLNHVVAWCSEVVTLWCDKIHFSLFFPLRSRTPFYRWNEKRSIINSIYFIYSYMVSSRKINGKGQCGNLLRSYRVECNWTEPNLTGLNRGWKSWKMLNLSSQKIEWGHEIKMTRAELKWICGNLLRTY